MVYFFFFKVFEVLQYFTHELQGIEGMREPHEHPWKLHLPEVSEIGQQKLLFNLEDSCWE